ncbi:hypothetical protein B0H16DRAFT_1470242 [Mycena metata]|uniref:Uncharacterized protein n=1 Tax=Mycena metata TaxID=1033252 RepID=A0AAD7HVB5_9AGAR|nr:hypothetical protein B0H16DRAFT_1470242 [Mycena metata]
MVENAVLPLLPSPLYPLNGRERVPVNGLTRTVPVPSEKWIQTSDGRVQTRPSRPSTRRKRVRVGALQTSVRARVVPTAASASLEVLSSKSIPAKTGEEHIFLQFILRWGSIPDQLARTLPSCTPFEADEDVPKPQLPKYQMNACIHAYYLEASFTISPQTIAPRGWLKSESTSEGGLNRILVGAPVSLPLSSESRAGKRANFHDLPALLECAASTSTSTLKSEPPSTENGLKSAASQGTRENKYSQLTHT